MVQRVVGWVDERVGQEEQGVRRVRGRLRRCC